MASTNELSSSEIWDLVHAERQQLAGDLASITGSAWETPSLCPGWSVHDVLAHLVDTAQTGTVAFVWSMVRSKGNFDRANDDGIARCKREDPLETLATLRDVTHLTKAPPAHRATRLVEAIVHGEDIRRPLHATGNYPGPGIVEALQFQLRTPVSFGGGKERAKGLRLTDPETGMAWGEGTEVSGTPLDLLLAISGRPVNPALLTGPGAQRFR